MNTQEMDPVTIARRGSCCRKEGKKGWEEGREREEEKERQEMDPMTKARR